MINLENVPKDMRFKNCVYTSQEIIKAPISDLPLPKLNACVRVTPRDRFGNSKIQVTVGKVIGETRELLILQKHLTNCKTTFNKSDFRTGILKFEYWHPPIF